MGIGTGVSHSGDDDDTSQASFTSRFSNNLINAPDTTILDNVTKPIVKVLGELFEKIRSPCQHSKVKVRKNPLPNGSRPQNTTVARNNDWDDDQKIRFFSDRLKGEALEWPENYVEIQGDDLNYDDWRYEIIERF